MGTDVYENYSVSLGFSRARKSAPGIAGTAMLYGYNVPISGQTDSRESDPYKEKTSLPGALADVSEFVCVAALAPRGNLRTRFGNINPIPFRFISDRAQCPEFRTEFSFLLGPTDPCSTAVHMEPFSTSAFKVLV